MSKFKFGDIVHHLSQDSLFIASGFIDDHGRHLVLSKKHGGLWPVEEYLLMPASRNNDDARRLEWLFENGMSKLDKCIVFGDDVSLDNFRERIDALMFESI